MITYLIPGLRFFHQGQFDGRKIRISPHLIRAPEESRDPEIEDFYERLLVILRRPTARSGQRQSLACQPAWEGNGSWDGFIVHAWTTPGNERILIVVNYAFHPGQCYLALPFPEIKNGSVRLGDLLSTAIYVREGNELFERGRYLDMQPWSYHVFVLELSQ